jgi:hypothetical protein
MLEALCSVLNNTYKNKLNLTTTLQSSYHNVHFIAGKQAQVFCPGPPFLKGQGWGENCFRPGSISTEGQRQMVRSRAMHDYRTLFRPHGHPIPSKGSKAQRGKAAHPGSPSQEVQKKNPTLPSAGRWREAAPPLSGTDPHPHPLQSSPPWTHPQPRLSVLLSLWRDPHLRPT